MILAGQCTTLIVWKRCIVLQTVGEDAVMSIHFCHRSLEMALGRNPWSQRRVLE